MNMKTIFDGERLPVSVRVKSQGIEGFYEAFISYQVFNEEGRLVADVTSPAAMGAVCRLLSGSSDS